MKMIHVAWISTLLLSAAISLSCCTFVAQKALADDTVDRSTPALEWAYQGAAVADMLTTLDIKNHPTLMETNPLLGEHPSNGKVFAYFAGTGVLHWAITRELVNGNMQRPLINTWEALTIGLEVGCAAHNYSIGLRFKR